MSVSRGQSRLLEEWRNRVRAEYGSAGLAAQAVHWMIQCGFPEAQIEVGLRIVKDELDHARLSHDVVVDQGGADEPMSLDIRSTASPAAAEGVLASLVDSMLRNFCLGETFAVPLFHAMRKTTSVPTARLALDRILRDEAIHRQFGWDSLDVLIEIDPAGVRARADAQVPNMLTWFERAYASAASQTEITALERSCGLITGEEYAEIYRRCLSEQIRPRFARRGITLP
jgi:hypothetical protein